MAWEGSTRRARLPPDWAKTTARILKRDGHRCTWIEHGHRCRTRATDVDHVINNDDHRDSNLRALCGPHHRAKSAREGAAAANRRWALRQRKRPEHPGLL